MPTLVMIDGRIADEQNAKISIFDRGFLYGDSVFETIRTYGGEPFALEDHLQRLEWSAKRVHIDVPCDRATVIAEIRELLEKANNPESMVRVMLTRGTGPLGLDPDLAGTPCRVVIVAQLNPPPPTAYTNGVQVITYRTQRLADATDAAGAKIGNYLISVLAMRDAKQKGAVEALVIDAQDRVVEGTSSNLFMIARGVLITPPEASGILPGITRAWVLALAAAFKLPVEYRAPTLSEVFAADEVFVSSTIREILPVVRVDSRQIGAGVPGSMTLRLLEAFRAGVSRGVTDK